ncbi:MAG: polysaccharide biosynthesis tyrosine autokinase [Verrucomicrobiota bacterium]
MKESDLREDDGDNRKFSFLEVLYLLRERAWLIVVCVIAGLFVGLGYAARQSKIFRAKTVLEVASEEPNVLRFEEGRSQDFTNLDALNTTVACFRSRTLLKNVVEKCDLRHNRAFSGQGWNPSDEQAVERVLRATKVEVRKGTRLIDITGESSDPQTAQTLANGLAAEFFALQMEQRASTSKLAVKFLMDEAAALKAKLQHSEEALQEYRENNRSVSLEEKQDTVVSKLKNQNAQWTEAKAARLRLEADCSKVMEHAGDVNALLSMACVSNHPAVAECKQQISTLESKISVLGVRYTEKHPKMIQARAQLADANALLNATVLKIPALLRSTYEAAIETEHNFETALREQEQAAQALNRQAIPYNVLYRDVETDRALYEAILKRLKQADIAKGVELTNIHIFESATLPSGPVNPGRMKLAALGIFSGLVLGVGLSFALHLVDSSLKTVDQTERLTGLSVIGAIPRSGRRIKTKDDIFLLSDPKSMIAEAFRSLRASLELAAHRKDGGVFLFTSAVPSEGKTFTSIHMAVAFAQQGLRTLLIDADLRAPKIGDIFACGRRTPGVSDLISRDEPVRPDSHATEIDNLFVLSAGTRILNPAEILSGPGFGKLLRRAAADFDAVIVDSAPIHAVSDTLLLVEHADWVCLVAKAGSTSANAVIRARQQLEMAGAKVVGLVLNQLPKDGGFGYYYYYSPGHYGEEGYGAKETEHSHKG